MRKTLVNEELIWWLIVAIVVVCGGVGFTAGKEARTNDDEAENNSYDRTRKISNQTNPATKRNNYPDEQIPDLEEHPEDKPWYKKIFGESRSMRYRGRRGPINEIADWFLYIIIGICALVFGGIGGCTADENPEEARRGQRKKRKENILDNNCDIIKRDFPDLRFGADATLLYFTRRQDTFDPKGDFIATFYIGDKASTEELTKLFFAVRRGWFSEDQNGGKVFYHADSTADDTLIYDTYGVELRSAERIK